MSVLLSQGLNVFNSKFLYEINVFIYRQYFLESIPNMRKMVNTKSLHFETMSVISPKPFVYHVELNRPDKLNAMNKPMWLYV